MGVSTNTDDIQAKGIQKPCPHCSLHARCKMSDDCFEALIVLAIILTVKVASLLLS